MSVYYCEKTLFILWYRNCFRIRLFEKAYMEPTIWKKRIRYDYLKKGNPDPTIWKKHFRILPFKKKQIWIQCMTSYYPPIRGKNKLIYLWNKIEAYILPKINLSQPMYAYLFFFPVLLLAKKHSIYEKFIKFNVINC